MEKDFEILTKDIKTKEDLISFLRKISEIRKIIFKREGFLSEKIGKEINEKLREFFKKMEEKNKISQNPIEQSLFLEKLEKYLKSLKEIKLEIAFEPREEFIEMISQWLEKELGQKIILEIIINPKIVAGAIIQYQGKWIDFSIAKEINKIYGGI